MTTVNMTVFEAAGLTAFLYTSIGEEHGDHADIYASTEHHIPDPQGERYRQTVRCLSPVDVVYESA